MNWYYSSCIDGIPSFLIAKNNSAAKTAIYGLAVLMDENIYNIDDNAFNQYRSDIGPGNEISFETSYEILTRIGLGEL